MSGSDCDFRNTTCAFSMGIMHNTASAMSSCKKVSEGHLSFWALRPCCTNSLHAGPIYMLYPVWASIRSTPQVEQCACSIAWGIQRQRLHTWQTRPTRQFR